MKKYIIFGGFDYALYYEMNSDAVLRGIDYFVDNNSSLIGKRHLGKEIKPPESLLGEDKDNILILIGSIPYRTEIELQLKDMGFEEDKHYIWAIAFLGDDKCDRLWKHTEWCCDEPAKSKSALDEFYTARYKIALRFVDWSICKSIIDMGAYTERVKPFLPEDIQYIPVDYVRWTDKTVLCDFNQYQFPTADAIDCRYDPQTTYMLSIGNIAYIKNWKWYLENVGKCAATLIIENNDFVRMNREWRREHWTHNNALFNHEMILFLQKCGYKLRDAVDFRLKSTIFKFVAV